MEKLLKGEMQFCWILWNEYPLTNFISLTSNLSNRILRERERSGPEAKKWKKEEQESPKPLFLRREKADTLRYSDNLHCT